MGLPTGLGTEGGQCGGRCHPLTLASVSLAESGVISESRDQGGLCRAAPWAQRLAGGAWQASLGRGGTLYGTTRGACEPERKG